MRYIEQPSDTDLERLFPEHPWREPVKLRLFNWAPVLGCRFCLYRWGSARALADGSLRRFVDADSARVHIAHAHPVVSWLVRA
jgi:hypothetical protein